MWTAWTVASVVRKIASINFEGFSRTTSSSVRKRHPNQVKTLPAELGRWPWDSPRAWRARAATSRDLRIASASPTRCFSAVISKSTFLTFGTEHRLTRIGWGVRPSRGFAPKVGLYRHMHFGVSMFHTDYSIPAVQLARATTFGPSDDFARRCISISRTVDSADWASKARSPAAPRGSFAQEPVTPSR